MPKTTHEQSGQEVGAYYDAMPYTSLPFTASTPEHIAAVARLFGLLSAPASHCRVLEIGCASGGNLIPHAQAHPESTYVGIDLSQVQLNQGIKRIKALELSNISLQRLNVGNVTASLGEFDYIICHGVYSWVSAEVQKMILQACQQNLSPLGLAFISYNCYPGWKFKEVVRDTMRYRSRDKSVPSEKLGYARGMFNFLHEMAPEKSILKHVLNDHAEIIKNYRDDYLVHDYLEPYNFPCYFHEFIDSAQESHLSYVGDATPSTMFVQNQPPSIAEPLMKECGNNQIVMEQYLDFVNNRPFRQSILTKKHRAADISYRLNKSRIADMYFAGCFELLPDQALSINDEDQIFTVNRVTGHQVTVKSAIGKAAVKVIGDHFPAAMSVRQIVENAQFLAQQVRPEDTDNVLRLLESLIIYGVVTYRLEPNQIATRVSARPQGYRPAQAQLRVSEMGQSYVVNPWHNAIELALAERLILGQLDGTRTATDLAHWLLEKEKSGDIHFKTGINTGDTAVTDPELKITRAHETVTSTLDRLCRQGLLSLS